MCIYICIYSHMTKIRICLISCHAQVRVVPKWFQGFQYSLRYHKWGIYIIRVVPYLFRRFSSAQSHKGQGEANIVYIFLAGYSVQYSMLPYRYPICSHLFSKPGYNKVSPMFETV